MSHHFDTPTARQDPRVNLCDFYLFGGNPGTTVMALTVNPDAGISAPETFREEGLYAFRFDLDGDAREDVTFKVRFGAVTHAEGGQPAHVQPFEIRRATGSAACGGADGDLLVAGDTGAVVKTNAGVAAFAGLVPDLFAGDAVALGRFRTALYKDNRFDPGAFQNRKNFFAKRNVTAVVIEVPSRLIGRGVVRGWATASLWGHAPEVQVSRWGLPLITHIFMPDMGMREDYNRAVPADDMARFSAQIGQVAEQLTRLAGSAASPTDYAKQLSAKLCPTALPYELGTAAAFDFAGFNGRKLTDDVMDVMLTLVTDTALGDGVAPDRGLTRDEFPYFGKPYTSADQVGVVPARTPSKL
jgi:Domain of unknown function (DUF4331)